MYATKVIEDCLRVADNYYTYPASEQRPGLEPLVKAQRHCAELIEKAHKFHLPGNNSYTDMFKSLDGTPLFSGAWGKIKLPYDIMYIDYNVDYADSPLPNDFRSSKRAILIHRLPEKYFSSEQDTVKCAAFVCNYHNEKRVWLLSPMSYGLNIGYVFDSNYIRGKEEGVKKEGSQQLVVGPDGPVIPIPLIEPEKYEKDKGKIDKVLKQVIVDDIADLHTLQCVLMLLNCKNVVPRNVHPSEKLNKKRKKSGKRPIYTYKLLDIILPSSYKENEKGEPTGIKKALHWRRGHWKYFGPPGLFGKYQGLFWWQHHLAGGDDDRVIEKEYRVNEPSS